MPPKPVTPRGSTPASPASTTTTKRAPSAAAGSKGKTVAAPSATNTASARTATASTARPATSTTTRGASAASTARGKSPKVGTRGASTSASSTTATKRAGSKKRRSASPAAASTTAAAKTAKKKSTKPVPVGNFYLPLHNLSFGSNPLKKKKNESDGSPNADDSMASAMSPISDTVFSPNSANFSFSDPATIYALSPSRVAASYERERANFENAAAASRAASPAATGGEVEGEEVASPEVYSAPVPEAPKFKSYFFGQPKPEEIAAAAASAAEPNATVEETLASEAAPQTDGENQQREASPQPASPGKIVSFDAAIATAEANQAAYENRGGYESSASPSSFASPSMTSTAAGSPRRSVSSRVPLGMKGRSESRASSSAGSAASGKKAGGKKKAKKEPVDPQDCRPAGPVERLFGDIAKTGMTSVPTLASLAIAARRTGSEVDLKAAAAAQQQSNDGTVIDASVTPLQTANALFNLGWMHYHALGGCGVNYKKAYAYFYDAATRFDHPMAYYYLGLQLRDGKGVEKNLLASHDAFQTSLALVGGSNVEPKKDENVPFQALVMPAEKTAEPVSVAKAAAVASSPSSAVVEGAAATGGDANNAEPVLTVISETNKRPVSRVAKAGVTLTFDGIEKKDVETVVNWQVGKLWANGQIVVLEEAPKEIAAPAAEEPSAASPTAGASTTTNRAASPMPSTPRAGSTSATVRGVSKATTAAAAGRGASTATTNKNASVGATKTAAKKAGSPAAAKKGAKKTSKKDPTNNTGGGPNVVLKRLIAAASEDATAAAAAGPSPSAADDGAAPAAAPAEGAPVVFHFRKVRYAIDKPVAVALFERCAANGFEIAGLAAEILRDAPIPRAEVE